MRQQRIDQLCCMIYQLGVSLPYYLYKVSFVILFGLPWDFSGLCNWVSMSFFGRYLLFSRTLTPPSPHEAPCSFFDFFFVTLFACSVVCFLSVPLWIVYCTLLREQKRLCKQANIARARYVKPDFRLYRNCIVASTQGGQCNQK